MPSYFRDPEAPTPSEPRRIGVVALIEPDGRLLLERRGDVGAWGAIRGPLGEHEGVTEGIAANLANRARPVVA
jgi:hypothetical protein